MSENTSQRGGMLADRLERIQDTQSELLVCIRGNMDIITAALRRPVVPQERQELSNIVNAERFNRERFRNDTEFADWVQSRARYAIRSQPQKEEEERE